MTKIQIPHWKCDFCGEVFDNKRNCEYHEKNEHKCPSCKHSYYVYGCELNCDLKKCNFKEKAND